MVNPFPLSPAQMLNTYLKHQRQLQALVLLFKLIERGAASITVAPLPVGVFVLLHFFDETGNRRGYADASASNTLDAAIAAINVAIERGLLDG